MSKSWFHDEIPDSLGIPIAVPMELEVKEAKVTRTKAATEAGKVGNKYMIQVDFSLVKPLDFKGLNHTERFVIGTDDDPDADKPGTWKRNGINLKKLVDNSGISSSNDVEADLLALKGQHVGAEAKAQKSNNPNFDGKPAIATYFKLGTRMVPETTAELDPGFVAPAAAPVGNGNGMKTCPKGHTIPASEYNSHVQSELAASDE